MNTKSERGSGGAVRDVIAVALTDFQYGYSEDRSADPMWIEAANHVLEELQDAGFFVCEEISDDEFSALKKLVERGLAAIRSNGLGTLCTPEKRHD